jgi:putative transposase
MYSIPVSDSRVSELITWYLRTLQKAIDIIWESIDWKYRLPKIERRKRNARTPWKIIQKKISERAERAVVAKVSPKNTSRTCPQCGYVVKTRVGRLFKCPRCGFELDRQKLASINIYLKYLRMRGLPHSNDPEETVKGELWVGVTPSGWSPVTWIPMKRDPESCETRGRGLGTKLYQAQ